VGEESEKGGGGNDGGVDGADEKEERWGPSKMGGSLAAFSDKPWVARRLRVTAALAGRHFAVRGITRDGNRHVQIA